MTAIFEVELPDGKILEIEAPANTPPAQIKAKASAYIAQSKAPAKKPLAAKSGYGWSDYAKDSGDYYSALGHHLANIPIAIGQTTANLAAYADGKIFGSEPTMSSLITGNKDKRPLQENADTYNQYVSQREKAYQARVPDSAASYMGATVGEVAPWLIPQTGAPKLMAAVDAGAVKLFGRGLAGRVASRSGQGLATVPFVPAAGDNYWSEKGTQAAIGLVAPNVPAALGSVVKTGADVGRYLFKPQSVADEMIANNIPATSENIAALRSAGSDGYMPTTARALDGRLSYEQNAMLVAREKALRNNKDYNATFAGRDAENNAWRLGIVEDIAKAKDPNALADAEAARRGAVKPFIDQYLQPVPERELARSRAIARQNAESLKPTEYPARITPPKADAFKETPDIVRTDKGARKLVFNPEKDDFRVWLAANGGVDPEVLRFAGIDGKMGGKRNVVVNAYNNTVVRKGGMTQDQLRNRMQEDGWLPSDTLDGTPTVGDNDALSVLSDSLHSGQKVYHPDSSARYMRQEQQGYADGYMQDSQMAADMGTTPEQLQRSADITDFRQSGDVLPPEPQLSASARGTMVDPSSVVKTLKNLSLDGNVVVSTAAKKQLAIIRANTDGEGNISLKALDDVRQNVSKTLFEVSKGTPDKQTAARYAPVASQIVRTATKQVPGYRDYLRAYADKSGPVNTISAGRDFLNAIKSGSRDSSGNPLLTLNQSKVFDKALDRKRYGIDPEARDKLRKVYESQQQDTITTNNLGIANSQTEFNKSNRLNGLLFGSVEGNSPGLLARAVGVGAGGTLGGGAGAIAGLTGVEAMSSFVNKRIMDKYAQGMLSPTEAAAALERVLQANPKTARELLIKNPAWRTLLALPRQEDPVLDAGLVTKTRAEAALDRLK